MAKDRLRGILGVNDMRRLVLKSVFPDIDEAKKTMLINEFYIEVEHGWLFFDNKREMDGWIDIDEHPERDPFKMVSGYGKFSRIEGA